MGRVKSKDRKKSRSLGSIFSFYVIGMMLGFIAWAVVAYVIFTILIMTGVVYPSNYAEMQIANSYKTLSSAETITSDMIPDSCKYMLFTEDGTVIDGNIDEEYVATAWNAVSSSAVGGEYYYKAITRSGEYLVFQYKLVPQFKSTFLRKYFPNVQNLIYIAIIVGGVEVMHISSLLFGRKLKKRMIPVLEATKKIGERDLEFEIEKSGVQEIDDCLKSIDDMRYALKESLQKQWTSEQEKNRQMSALAHDIKTPLTVVRGNAELLLETELDDEQKCYADYITGSAQQIENYVQTLIDVTKSQEGLHEATNKVRVQALLEDIKKQSLGLTRVYDQKLQFSEKCKTDTIDIAYDQLVRAVMNIIRNAAEHSPEGSDISVDVIEKFDELRFTVTDSGKGFSQEALKHATEQFFMDDNSRSGGMHYGIGLFFAMNVAKMHGGDIKLSNSEERGGVVELSIKI